MSDPRPTLFNRDDTFFGVCEGLGEDLGIHANWLRLGVAGAFFFAPVQVVIGYLVMGVIVAASRWFAPVPMRAVDADQRADAGGADAPAEFQVPHYNDADLAPLPLAA